MTTDGLLKKLALAHEVECRAREESDRLLSLARDLGATDLALATAMGVDRNVIRMRRRRRGLRDGDRMRGNCRPRQVARR